MLCGQPGEYDEYDEYDNDYGKRQRGPADDELVLGREPDESVSQVKVNVDLRIHDPQSPQSAPHHLLKWIIKAVSAP
jgi:hypothetical protein